MVIVDNENGALHWASFSVVRRGTGQKRRTAGRSGTSSDPPLVFGKLPLCLVQLLLQRNHVRLTRAARVGPAERQNVLLESAHVRLQVEDAIGPGFPCLLI
jgi:hypothetical protein